MYLCVFAIFALFAFVAFFALFAFVAFFALFAFFAFFALFAFFAFWSAPPLSQDTQNVSTAAPRTFKLCCSSRLPACVYAAGSSKGGARSKDLRGSHGKVEG